MAGTLVKILVVYHKKAPLFKSDVLVPIHAGRAVAKEKSKDGFISDDELKWLQNHMIGDDTGDNISYLNRYLNEMTAVYWAWKNYDKLGDPQYIGLCHYRRLWKNDCSINVLKKILKGKPFVLCTCYTMPKSHRQTWYDSGVEGHSKYIFDVGEKVFCSIYPEQADKFKQWAQSRSFHSCNLFLLPKKEFFAYCEWIFPVLIKMHDVLRVPEKNTRAVGFFAERMTSFWIDFFAKLPLHTDKIIDKPISYKRRCFSKVKFPDGRRCFYFLGIKIFSYKKPAK